MTTAISKSDVTDMGHVRMPEQVELQICVGGNGNGTCPDSNQRWIFKSVWVHMGHVRIPEKVNGQIGFDGKCGPFPRKRGFANMGHFHPHRFANSLFLKSGFLPEVWISGKVDLQTFASGNGPCPNSRKDEFPNLFGAKWTKSGCEKK